MSTHDMTLRDAAALPSATAGALAGLLPFLGLLVLALLLPLTGNEYWALIATRAAIYWILVSGLNLIIGFAGQLAIGYVALLTLGAYTTSVLAGGNVLPPLHPYLALCSGQGPQRPGHGQP